MQTQQPLSLEQIRAFLEARDEVGFQGRNREEVYGWVIQKVPKTHRYHVSSHGRLAITAILTMDRASIALLNKAAA